MFVTVAVTVTGSPAVLPLKASVPFRLTIPIRSSVSVVPLMVALI